MKILRYLLLAVLFMNDAHAEALAKPAAPPPVTGRHGANAVIGGPARKVTGISGTGLHLKPVAKPYR